MLQLIGCFRLSRHLSYFSSSLLLFQCYYLQDFFLDVRIKKRKRKTNYWSSVSIFAFAFWSVILFLFLSILFYDLPTFFATFVFVFLLVDASPFLLDFFLVAIISWSFYIILLLMIYLLFPLSCSSGFHFLEADVYFYRSTIPLLYLFLSYRY